MDHLMAGIEDILGKHGNHHIRDKFKRFDNRFIRPFLLRNYQVNVQYNMFIIIDILCIYMLVCKHICISLILIYTYFFRYSDN